MSRTDRMRNEPTLKPIGVTLAAVVAGLGAGGHAQAETHAGVPLEPTTQARTHYVDPTADPEFGAELLGPSEPVAPFSEPQRQAELFDRDVPLSGK